MMKRLVALLVGLVGIACMPHVVTADTVTLVGDAYTKSTAPISNFGTATSLIVQGPPVNATVENAYLQFYLWTLPAGTTGGDVAKATLTVGVNKITHAGPIDVFRVTSAWTEAGVTAATAPSLGATPEATFSLTASDKNDFRTIDVTQLVKDWLDGVLPNNGVALVSNAAGVSVQLDSKESTATSHWPQLDVSITPVHEFGIGNSFVGSAGNFSTTGMLNTALGAAALPLNDTGGLNTAVGSSALFSNSSGSQNTAIGRDALTFNSTGGENTAAGAGALRANDTGSQNTAVGRFALGQSTGQNNIAVGAYAGSSLAAGSANIYIGNPGAASESNTIRIGDGQTATYIDGINGTAVSGGAVVFADGNGQLGTGTVANTRLSAAGSSAGQVLTSNGSGVTWQAPPAATTDHSVLVKDANGVLIGTMVSFNFSESSVFRNEAGTTVILFVDYSGSGFVANFGQLFFTSTDCTGTPLLYPFPTMATPVYPFNGTGYYAPTTTTNQTFESFLQFNVTQSECGARPFFPPNVCCYSQESQIPLGAAQTISLNAFTPPFKLEVQ